MEVKSLDIVGGRWWMEKMDRARRTFGADIASRGRRECSPKQDGSNLGSRRTHDGIQHGFNTDSWNAWLIIEDRSDYWSQSTG